MSGRREIFDSGNIEFEEIDLKDCVHTFRIFDDGLVLDDCALGTMGAKVVNLMEARRLEIPVMPGFVVSSEVGKEVRREECEVDEGFSDKLSTEVWPEVYTQMNQLEKDATEFRDNGLELEFGNPKAPLLVSVRSGSKFSMPGTLKTVLNVGLNDQTVIGLSGYLGERAAWDCYVNFCLTFIEAATGVNAITLHEHFLRGVEANGWSEVQQLKGEVEYLKNWYTDSIIDLFDERLEIPQNPVEQLLVSIASVYWSWDYPQAVAYRQKYGISNDVDTAVLVMPMAFGNRENGEGGSGVVFTHNMTTGDEEMKITFASGEQGIRVVGGVIDPEELGRVPEEKLSELEKICCLLVDKYGWPQDIEFVVEDERLIMIQARDAKPTAFAAMQIITDLFNSGRIDRGILIGKLSQARFESLGWRFDEREIDDAKDASSMGLEEWVVAADPYFLVKGDPVGGNAVVGRLALSAEKAKEIIASGGSVILAVEHLDQGIDFDGIVGVMTKLGTAGGHVAASLNPEGVSGAIGCPKLEIDVASGRIIVDGEIMVNEGEIISLDGSNGDVFWGELSVVKTDLTDEMRRVKEIKDMMVGKAGGMFIDAVVAGGLLAPYKDLIKGLKVELETPKWLSVKSMDQEAINVAIPEQMRIPYQVINAENEQGIRERAKEGLRKGREATFRSAYKDPIGGPWFRVKDDEGVTEFIDEVLPVWRGDGNLAEVIVGWIPEGKMDRDLADEHFVYNMRLPKGSREVVATVNLGTPHTRTFETADPKKLIELRARLDEKFDDGVGEVRFLFGEDYVLAGEVSGLVEKMLAFDHEDRNLMFLFRQLKQRLIGKVRSLERESMKEEEVVELFSKELVELVREGLLSEEIVRLIVDPKALAVARHIKERVFKKWWKEIVIGVAAVESYVGGDVMLEGQGRVNLDDFALQWLLVYGMKWKES